MHIRPQTTAVAVDHFDYVPAIAGLSAAADERQAYTDVAAREALPDDVVCFWKSLMQQNRLTKLAKLVGAYLALPVASVDMERSFSKYGSLLSPSRSSLATESIKAYCSVFYIRHVGIGLQLPRTRTLNTCDTDCREQ